MSGNFKNFLKRLSKNYRLNIIDNKNYTEVYSASISKLKILLIAFAIFIIASIFVLCLVFYTPLKKTVPGYPTDELREIMLYNSIMLDSLNVEIEIRDQYLQNIKRILSDEEVVDTITYDGSELVDVEMEEMINDSIFDELIRPDKYKFSYNSSDEDITEITKLNLFTPVKGVVTNKFDASPGHFGTDIVGEVNSHISSILDGTVIFAEWSISTGYVVQIQHNYNLISIYKHNSDIIVKPGDKVKTGDLIAIMGNEGELSTGPHLHFELWQNGIPLNPEHYISF